MTYVQLLHFAQLTCKTYVPPDRARLFSFLHNLTANPRRFLYHYRMSDLPILDSNSLRSGREELAMAGFRVDPTHEGPQFFTLLAVGGDNERPLVAEGRIIFFVRTTLVHKALAMDPSLAVLGTPPRGVETICDVAQTLYLVNSQDEDPDGVVLDCLLIFDDLVRATGLSMPERYQGILTELAARLTEGQSLKKVFSNEALRDHVEDALLWCVGAITMKARFLTS
jgi:hypothetical protein